MPHDDPSSGEEANTIQASQVPRASLGGQQLTTVVYSGETEQHSNTQSISFRIYCMDAGPNSPRFSKTGQQDQKSDYTQQYSITSIHEFSYSVSHQPSDN